MIKKRKPLAERLAERARLKDLRDAIPKKPNRHRLRFSGVEQVINPQRRYKVTDRKGYFDALREARNERWKYAREIGFGQWAVRAWKELRSTPRSA